MNFISKGNSIQEAHMKFDVGTTTIKEWKKLKAETGKLEKRPLNRAPKKICLDKLDAYITINPDSYLDEIAKEFDCTTTTIPTAPAPTPQGQGKAEEPKPFTGYAAILAKHEAKKAEATADAKREECQTPPPQAEQDRPQRKD